MMFRDNLPRAAKQKVERSLRSLSNDKTSSGRQRFNIFSGSLYYNRFSRYFDAYCRLGRGLIVRNSYFSFGNRCRSLNSIEEKLRALRKINGDGRGGVV